VGAQIGIYNPSGEKVGRVSHLRNKEVLFIVGPEESLVEEAASLLEHPDTVAAEQEVLF
jgi:adenine-specific DNA-methyltransferase